MNEDRLARPLKFTNTFCVRAYLVLIELIDSDNHLGDLAIGAIVNSTESLGLFLSISKHRAYSHLESTVKPVAVYVLAGRSVICSDLAQALLLISRYVYRHAQACSPPVFYPSSFTPSLLLGVFYVI